MVSIQDLPHREPCKNCGFLCHGGYYCPNCGQQRSMNILKVREFIAEVFKGFLSWDAKFWYTVIPLFFRPGKVSKDYVAGKRNYYTNPFRFYFTISILFFFLLGFLIKKESYSSFNDNNSNPERLSIQNNARDSLRINSKFNSGTPEISLTIFGKDMEKFNRFLQYTADHPEESTTQALKKMNLESTFKNKFLYNKTVLMRRIVIEKDTLAISVFKNQIISYTSISLFVLLPFFALILKLFYLKQKKRYMEHLIFVFYTQTFLFSLLFLIVLLNELKFIREYYLYLWGGGILVFLVYLYKSFRIFYQQGHLITAIKFLSINICLFYRYCFRIFFIILKI